MTDTPNTVPVVSVVGKGDSGKTTFLEKLIRELAHRGVRVATVKHHIHDFDIDVPGKDSHRHAQAGAFATMVSSPSKFSVIQDVDQEMSLDAIVAVAQSAGADILITEGYKREGRNRIEVSRAERSDSLVCDPDELVALVTDNEPLAEQTAATGIPVFDLNEGFTAVADLVVDRFLGSERGTGVPRAVPQTRSVEDCLSTGLPSHAPPGEVHRGD